MKYNFEVNKRRLNIQGRNIKQGYALKFPRIVRKKEEEEINGYGISKASEKLDEIERDPFNKLKNKLSKIQIKF